MAFDPYAFSLAVMTLRQFERAAVRKQDEMRETQHLGSEHTNREVQNKQLKETEKYKKLMLVRIEVSKRQSGKMSSSLTSYFLNLFQATVAGEKPSERNRSVGAKVQLPAGGK